jgi:hypothetical protein
LFTYDFLADLVAGAHVGYVLAVVLGLVVILAGGLLGWQWVRNRWFRLVHLTMIVGVVIRAAIWRECPLTWWERDLRELAGVEATGVGKFLHDVIHPTLPWWVFPIIYVAFALLVIAAFWFVPVRWRRTPAAPAPSVGPVTLAPAPEGPPLPPDLASTDVPSQGA